MEDNLNQLNRQQLQEQLLKAYSQVLPNIDENDSIRNLKGELYRRGAARDEIVCIALAAFIRRSMN